MLFWVYVWTILSLNCWVKFKLYKLNKTCLNWLQLTGYQCVTFPHYLDVYNFMLRIEEKSENKYSASNKELYSVPQTIPQQFITYVTS